jgi:hypothetical protein
MKVRTRNGYLAAGSGAEVGSKGAPERIRPADTTNSIAATIAVRRIHRAKVFGALTHDEGGRPRRDAPDIGGNAGLEAEMAGLAERM